MKKRGIFLLTSLLILTLLDFSLALTEKCEDTDGNLSLNEQSFLPGSVKYSSESFSTNFIDWCIKEKIIHEQICNKGLPETKGIKCKYGCQGGSCNKNTNINQIEISLPDISALPKNFTVQGKNCKKLLQKEVNSWFEPIIDN